MNSFSGRLPISSSFIWSYGFLPCSFICNIFFCHLILSDLLCLWSPFCRLQGHSSSCFQCICPLIGEGVTGACVGFFLGGSGVCAVVGGAESCALMGWTMSDGVLGVVCELSMTLGSLSVDGWGCVPVLLVVWCGASSSGVCRQLGGAGPLCWDGDLWKSSHWLIFPGARNSLAFQRLGLSTLTLEAQVWPLAREQRPCQLHGGARKRKEWNTTKKTNKQNPRQMIKARPNKKEEKKIQTKTNNKNRSNKNKKTKHKKNRKQTKKK